MDLVTWQSYPPQNLRATTNHWEGNMLAFRALLGFFIICVSVYTSVVIGEHGWNLFPVFFRDMFAMTWSGQFNPDFTCFLTLSGLWLAWRHKFTPMGISLGVLGFFGGIMVLAPFLIYISFKDKGNISKMLLGNRQVQD